MPRGPTFSRATRRVGGSGSLTRRDRDVQEPARGLRSRIRLLDQPSGSVYSGSPGLLPSREIAIHERSGRKLFEADGVDRVVLPMPVPADDVEVLVLEKAVVAAFADRPALSHAQTKAHSREADVTLRSARYGRKAGKPVVTVQARGDTMSNSKTASIPKQSNPRRSFIKQVLAAGAAVSASSAFTRREAAGAIQESGIGALDHVAIPIQNVEEMVSFYRALGFVVRDSGRRISIHFGDQKINFHHPSRWPERDVYAASGGGPAAMRRLLLGVGRHAGIACRDAGACGCGDRRGG